MKELLLITFVGALVIGLTGCSSMEARSNGTQSGLYPGVKQSMDNYNKPDMTHTGFMDVVKIPITIIDLPSSFALDTALLPIDILGSVFKGKDDKPSEPEAAPQP